MRPTLVVAVGLLVACQASTGPSRGKLTSIFLNRSADSAIVILEGADLQVLRQGTLQARDSTCWTTSLSDSVWYNVGLWIGGGLYFPFARGSSNGVWVTSIALNQAQTWVVTIDSTNVGSVGGYTTGHC